MNNILKYIENEYNFEILSKCIKLGNILKMNKMSFHGEIGCHLIVRVEVRLMRLVMARTNRSFQY